MIIERKAIAAFGLAAMLCGGSAIAAEVTLKAVSAWPEKNTFSVNYEKFIEKVNAEGKGVIQIQYLGGGAKVMPPFEVGNAVRNGVVDIAHVAGGFYATLLPEADMLNVSNIPAQEWRKNGALSIVQSLWAQKMQVHYLARSIDQMPFHLYTRKPVPADKPDLTGFRMRAISTYREVLGSMGATMVTLPPNELYAALERGVVDGFAWPAIGLFDLGLQEHTKFRLDPGFYNVEAGILVNLAAWNKLTAAQKAVLDRAALYIEDLQNGNKAIIEADHKRQAEAGIKTIRFEGEVAKKYVQNAYDKLWQALIARNPDFAAKLRPLIER